MSFLYQLSIIVFCLVLSLTVVHIFTESYFQIGVLEILFLLVTRELKHFIHKRRLVTGDLVFIKHHGKNRKAFVVAVSGHGNTVQAKFFNRELNLDINQGNWYPLSRIVLPEFLGGKAAKVLYSDLED